MAFYSVLNVNRPMVPIFVRVKDGWVSKYRDCRRLPDGDWLWHHADDREEIVREELLPDEAKAELKRCARSGGSF